MFLALAPGGGFRLLLLQGILDLVEPLEHGRAAVGEGFGAFLLDVFDDFLTLFRLGEEEQGGTGQGAGHECKKRISVGHNASVFNLISCGLPQIYGIFP